MRIRNKMIAILCVAAILVSVAPHSFAAENGCFQDNPTISSVTYSMVDGNIYEQVEFYDNLGQTTMTLLRTISPDGAVVIQRNNTIIGTFSINEREYQVFLNLVGESSTQKMSDYKYTPGLALYSANGSSDYGCGHNDKIHTYLGSKSQTFYRSTPQDWATVGGVASILMSIFGLPYANIVGIASIVVGLMGGDSHPHHVTVTEWVYNVATVGTNEYLFTCHHCLISEYNDSNSLTASYMEYTQTIGG